MLSTPSSTWSVSSIPESIGYWAAGLADGEGCFIIRRGARDRPPLTGKRRGIEPRGIQETFRPEFHLALRIDDTPVLELLANELGFGDVRYKYTGRSAGSPMSSYRVTRNADIFRLVEVFDRFPLRSKKTKDYAVWREAVLTVRDSPADYYGGRARRLAELRDRLRAGRVFVPPSQICL